MIGALRFTPTLVSPFLQGLRDCGPAHLIRMALANLCLW